MSTHPARSVAVVGAGWAGLAAAVELLEAGYAVTVFEAGRLAGGRARSVMLDGREVDNGQHLLLGAYLDTLSLMGRVGIDPADVLERLPLQVIDTSGFRLALPRWPAPFNLAWGLLSARGVSLSEKLRTAIWMQGLKSRHFQLADTSLSVATWLDSEGQTGALRRHLWEPLCLAALNTPAERASAQHFANVLRDSLGSPRREDTDLLLPRVPLGQVLAGPAIQWLGKRGAELRFSHRVRSLEADQDGIAIDGERFDATILATAPSHLAALSPALARTYDYEPIATVYLQFGAGTRLGFALENRLAAQKAGDETCDLTYWVVDRGNGLLACVLSGKGSWEALDDAALAKAAASRLGFGEPNWQGVIREKRATFSCRPGIARPGEKTHSPRLFLAGDHTWADYPATLEGAVRSGLRAARALRSGLSPA